MVIIFRGEESFRGELSWRNLPEFLNGIQVICLIFVLATKPYMWRCSGEAVRGNFSAGLEISGEGGFSEEETLLERFLLDNFSLGKVDFQKNFRRGRGFRQVMKKDKKLNKNKHFSNESRLRRICKAELTAVNFPGGIYSEGEIIRGKFCREQNFTREEIPMGEFSAEGRDYQALFENNEKLNKKQVLY